MNAAIQTDFDRALDLYVARHAQLDALPADTDPALEDEACDLRTAAEERLFRQRAHSIADVRAMAEIIFMHPDALPSSDHVTALLNALRILDKDNASRTFDPSSWLRQLEHMGGGWVIQGEKISFLHPAERKEGMSELMWELETRDGCEAVKAEIRKREVHAIEVEPEPTWGELLSAYQTADAKLAQHEATSDPEHEAGTPECEAFEALTDRLADEHVAALEAMFRHRSPDATAYRIKTQAYAKHEVYTWNTAKELAGIIADEAGQLGA